MSRQNANPQDSRSAWAETLSVRVLPRLLELRRNYYERYVVRDAGWLGLRGQRDARSIRENLSEKSLSLLTATIRGCIDVSMKTAQYKVTVWHSTHVRYQRPERQTKFEFVVEAPDNSHGTKAAAESVGMPKSLRSVGQGFWRNTVKDWPESGRKNYTEWSVERIYGRAA